ncbi:MAG: methyltransferase domain-containing protein [Tidjanibacter sp.]|nr:methyltransferase domain-containing protein [Tidjanibacter sp.]
MASGFRFKQFSIEQEHSAMKVGTDGVLLGAWASLDQKDGRILDIGCGTGLLCLMAAQRTTHYGSHIVGVEIDPESMLDAESNVACSQWKERIELHNLPIQEFHSEESFDHIISNPPYFVNSLTSPDRARTTARHTSSLPFEVLTNVASKLLAANGRLSLILPFGALADITLAAVRSGLFLRRRTDVSSKERSAPLRVLLEFGHTPTTTIHTTLAIHTTDGDFTDDYKNLTKEFYLKF